jgi:hypothetical protein
MFCNKYYGQANKDLQFLVLSNKKLIKKNILKTIKYFFLKKTFVAKKFFLSSKIKNYKIFKFLIFSNKRLKFKKSLLSEDFLVKKKHLLGEKKSLLYIFLINKLVFYKKKRI